MSRDTVTSQFVVQFPHPGCEHNPGMAQRQPWNAGNHGRKFLQSFGRYVDGNRSLGQGNVVFWGEWEAPSYYIIPKSWERADALPRFLHRPVWERPTPNERRLNTDPWVFGDSFRYSNCRQLTRSALQRLTPGSLILFGSTIDAQFVIDTVFVVKDSCPFSPRRPPETDEAFRVCTVESLLTTGNRDDPFTLYRGAAYEDRFNDMYSFVPCRLADADDMRFARPCISLGGYVNPKNWRAACLTPCSQADVRRQWENVRKQVVDAGCLLGVWFATPKLDMDSTAGTSAEISQVNVTAPKGCGQT
jgi:hypothetical protein